MESLTYKIMIWSSVVSTAVTVVAFIVFVTKEIMGWP